MRFTALFPGQISASRGSRGRTAGPRFAQRRRATRPRLEVLEGRALLSIWTVTDNSDNAFDQGSLLYAVDNAPSGTTINFAPNVTFIDLAGPLQLKTNLDIEGPGANVLTVYATGFNTLGSPVDTSLDTGSGVTATVAGLTFAYGDAFAFAAVTNQGTLIMTNCAVTGNTTGISNGGTLTMTNCTVTGNTTGISNDGTLTMTNCTVSHNFGLGIGNGGTLTTTNCTVNDNLGVGIYNNSGATSTIANCTLAGNSAPNGNGGAIENVSTNGIGGSVTMTNCTLAGNSAPNGKGGAIENHGGSVMMTDCTLSGNSASDGGGGAIDNSSTAVDTGTMSITNCTLSGNSALGGFGGGMENESKGPVTMTNCTIAGNSAANGGGIGNLGTLILTNCTLAGNSGAFGGGIYNDGTLGVTNCTLSTNSAVFGGGVYNLGALAIGNTIIAGNNASVFPPDVDGKVTSNGFNLIGNTSGASGFVATDLLNQNPLLGALQDNGGPTQTMALLPGSPAIDAGSNALIPAGVTTDQRGFARIVDDVVDIGAFESRGFTIAATSGNAQSTTVDGGFLNPLVVTVTSPYGDPVQGGVVTFTAPGSGAGALFPRLLGPTTVTTKTIDPTGQAAVGVGSNLVAGSYAVTATARGANFATGISVGFSLTNTPRAAIAVKATAGTPQSTTVGYAFASPLQVLVTDEFGNPVPGMSVMFVAPTSGASGNFGGDSVVTTNAQGIAEGTFTANTKSGSYFVTASVTGVGTPAIFRLTNTPDVASRLLITSPATATSGVPFSFTVTMLDQYGNTATGYRGTIHFSSSDLKATLPANYLFVAANNGAHTFAATLNTLGPQTLIAGDTVTLSVTSTVGLNVASKSIQAALAENPPISGIAPAAESRTVRAGGRHRADRQFVAYRHRDVKPHVHDRAGRLASEEHSRRRNG
jgi:hypothetical protein